MRQVNIKKHRLLGAYQALIFHRYLMKRSSFQTDIYLGRKMQGEYFLKMILSRHMHVSVTSSELSGDYSFDMFSQLASCKRYNSERFKLALVL